MSSVEITPLEVPGEVADPQAPARDGRAVVLRYLVTRHQLRLGKGRGIHGPLRVDGPLGRYIPDVSEEQHAAVVDHADLPILRQGAEGDVCGPLVEPGP